MNRKIEQWILWGAAGVYAAYILLRAWLLPMTVDEAATAINHVPRLVFDTLTYQSEANPNNHMLNTILIKLFTGAFGWHHFVVRLPVVLGGLLYGYCAVELSRKVSEASWVRIFTLLMLLGNPFLLEFFSLARGYGLAVGWMSLAILTAWNFFEKNEARLLKYAIICAGLAAYSNFTLLIFFAPFVALLLVTAAQMNPSWKGYWLKTKPAYLTLGVFALLWLTPLKRLSKDSEIVNWNALGTFFESIQRSVRAAIHANAFLGNDSDLTLTWLLTAGMTAILVVALWRWKTQRFRLAGDPRVWLVLLLAGACATNVAQVYLTKTPYLQARLSLFYWPMVALCLGAAAAWIQERYPRWAVWLYMTPLLVLFLINMVRCVNLRNTLEWYHDSDTFTVLDFIQKTYEAEGRTEPFVLDTEWFMQNSLSYHLDKKFRNYDRYVKMVPFHARQSPQRNSDFFYAINIDSVRDVLDYYDIVLRIPHSSMILLRKKQ